MMSKVVVKLRVTTWLRSYPPRCYYHKSAIDVVDTKLQWTEGKLKDCLNGQKLADKWWSDHSSKHPGKFNLPVVSLPDKFTAAASVFLHDYDLTEIRDIGRRLKNFLHQRKPITHQQYAIIRMMRKNDTSVNNPGDLSFSYDKLANLKDELTDGHYSNGPNQTRQHAVQQEKDDSKHWKSVLYDDIITAAYLSQFSAAGFASSMRVLSEIRKRLPDFQPDSLLDFGSGVGSNTWAANELWSDSIRQYVCVDSSKKMNSAAMFLFSGGKSDAFLPGIFIRQHLPIAFSTTFDVVTASYTLSEMQLPKDRENIIRLLWEKTDRFLVLVEHGNIFGHRILMEARNFLVRSKIGLGKSAKSLKKAPKGAQVFAPCPHEFECPLLEGRSSCTVSQKFRIPKFAGASSNEDAGVTFSYLILEKVTDGSGEHRNTWPRIISSPKSNRKCVSCNMCTAGGTVDNFILSKNTDSKHAFSLMKKSKLGDLLPLTKK